MTPQNFFNKFYPIAFKARTGTKIFTATMLSQAAAESGWGTSELCLKANNYFGIKHFGTYPNKYKEYRKYNSIQESFDDYVEFLQENSRYKYALQQKNASLQLGAIAAAGYAEATNYRQLILGVYDIIQPLLNEYVTAHEKDSKNKNIGAGGLILLVAAAVALKNSNK